MHVVTFSYKIETQSRVTYIKKLFPDKIIS